MLMVNVSAQLKVHKHPLTPYGNKLLGADFRALPDAFKGRTALPLHPGALNAAGSHGAVISGTRKLIRLRICPRICPPMFQLES